MIKTKHFAPRAGPPLGATRLIGIGEKEYILGADANVVADVAGRLYCSLYKLLSYHCVAALAVWASAVGRFCLEPACFLRLDSPASGPSALVPVTNVTCA